MIVIEQNLRLFTAMLFSIISSLLFSASIDSRTDNTLLKPGIWQSKLDAESFLYITNEHFAFYVVHKKSCEIIGREYPIKNANVIIKDVSLKKEFSNGWLLSPTPPIPTLAITQSKNSELQTTTYRQINEFPSLCQTEHNTAI
jgi:hypothetical protein